MDSAKSFSRYCKVAGVSKLGLVFGWAIVSTQDGEPYFDTQGDYAPAEAVMEAAADFMKQSREARGMHGTENEGSVLFALPVTAEVCEALGMESKREGLVIGMKPSAAMLEKFKDGTYSGFSIGGEYLEVEEVA